MVANQSNLTTSMILPLENGDRLTRNEFERHYAAMPHLMIFVSVFPIKKIAIAYANAVL
jgi:hypothetical protein